MAGLAPAIAACIAFSGLLTLVYVYLYAVDRHRYLLYWASAWAIYAARFVLQLGLARWDIDPGFPLILLSTLPALFLMMGAFGVCETAMPRPWLWGLGGIWLFTLAGALTGLLDPLYLGTASAVYIAMMYFATARLLMGAHIATRFGRAVLALVFVAWAVHNLFYPLVAAYPQALPWGYAAGAMLAMMAALTMVVLHFHAARADLTASERYQRTLFESTRDAILILSNERERRILDVNQALLDLFGYRREDIVGHDTRQMHAPGRFEQFGREVYPYVRRHGFWRGEWPFAARDGSEILTETTLAPVRTGGQEPPRYIAILRDISDRKRIEDALRVERDRAQAYLDIVAVAVIARDVEGRVTLINQEGARLLGHDAAELTAQDWFALCVPEPVRDDERAQHRRLVFDAPDGIQHSESRVVTASGEERLVTWRTVVLRDEAGRAVGTLSSGEDITERRHIDTQRRRLAAAVEQAAELVFILDPGGRIEHVNPAFTAVTGYTAEEAVGTDTYSLLHCEPDAEGGYEHVWRLLRTHGRWQGRCSGRKKNGVTYEADMSITAIRDNAGRVTHFAVVQRDITREAQLEQALLHAQKMEAIGTLAGGIAHDFNNILGAIMGYGEMALEDAAPETRAGHSIREVMRAAGRAQDLVRQILTFSRKTQAERKPFRLQTVAEEAVQLMRGGLPANIQVHIDCDSQCAPVLGDPSQIHQVVVNLCTNAYHAMRPEGGQLAVTAGMQTVDEGAAATLEIAPGDYGFVTVADTGTGIAPELLPRIFEPYFSTKGPGEGTGMGLATVHGIVRNHQGGIQVETAAGEGTRVRIYLPLATPESHASGALQTPVASPRGSARVLFVDDETALVDLAVQGLAAYGYAVTGCFNAEEALSALRNEANAYDVVVTDQMMPGMSGLELARAILVEHGHLPIVLCTGFSDLVDEETAQAAGVRRFLHKPLLPSELARHIHEVVSLSGPSRVD